jgi:hypothetical protein
VVKSQIFGNFVKANQTNSVCFVFYSNCSNLSDFCLNLGHKRWLKVRLFGHFVKSAQYKKHIGRLLLQLLKPKQLLTQPWLNGGQKSDFRPFRESHPDKERLVRLLFQFRKSERLLAQPLIN